MAYNVPQHSKVWANVVTVGLNDSGLLKYGCEKHFELERIPGEEVKIPVWASFTVNKNSNTATPDDVKAAQSAVATLYTLPIEEYFIKWGFSVSDILKMRKNMRDGLWRRATLDMILDFETQAGTALTAAITSKVYGDNSTIIEIEEFVAAKEFALARSMGSEVICLCSTVFYSSLITHKNINVQPLLEGVRFIKSDQACDNEHNFIYPKELFNYGRLGGGIFFKMIPDAGSGSDFTFLYHLYGLLALDEINDNGCLLKTKNLTA